MQASVSSLHSAVPSLSSTASIIPHGSVGSATMDAQPTARCRLRQRRSIRILCNLWLLSASCFLELGLVNETLKAIEEAENVDWTNNAGVWCMLGRLRLVENKIDSAIAAFQKGLVCDGNDVECRVWLAKAYIQHGDLEVAEGLLEFVTRSNGWNCTEAWYVLYILFICVSIYIDVNVWDVGIVKRSLLFIIIISMLGYILGKCIARPID